MREKLKAHVEILRIKSEIMSSLHEALSGSVLTYYNDRRLWRINHPQDWNELLIISVAFVDSENWREFAG